MNGLIDMKKELTLSFVFLFLFIANSTFAGTIDVKINRLTERMGPGACFVDFEATNNSNYNIQQFYLNFVAKDSNGNLIKEQTGSISSLRPGTNKTSGSTGMIGSVSCNEIALIEISWHKNLKLADGRWLTRKDKHIAELKKLSANTNIFWKDSRIKASSTTFKIQKERPPEIAADPDLVISSDRELMTMSPLMQKKLNMSKGKTILVKSIYLWKFDKSEWLQGGPLHLMNDDSLGKATRLTCTISADDGDKFMENPQRQDVSMKGILKGFDGSSGTVIEPCKIGQPQNN